MVRTFEQWMAAVDAIVERNFGLSSDDLVDVDYSGMFEDGCSPASAVRAAIEASS